jgi:hypothetical protein
MKVVFCVPSLEGPTTPLIESLEASLPLLDKWDHAAVEERGCPYISSARATMLHKALEAGADVILFLDYDLSWRPEDLVRLIETEGDVVAGLYRFKQAKERYMGSVLPGPDGMPIIRDDGCVKAELVPAGFLKITRRVYDVLRKAHPELLYGNKDKPHLDLFNHGAHEGLWWGEDYAFSRRWTALGEEIWVVPDLCLTHHGKTEAFPGNYHKFLLRQPGGRDAEPLATEDYLEVLKGS